MLTDFKGVNMFRRFLLTVVILFLFEGCIQPSTGVTPSASHSSAKRVGYLVNVRQYPTHTHVGTTALTNFTKTYPYQWKIPTYIENKLAKNLKETTGAKPINLRKEAVSPHELNGLIKNVNGTWMVAKGKREVYEKLTKRLNLSAVVIINESKKQAIKDCGILGCTEVDAKGYGVLSRSFINQNKFFSATAFYATIYKLNPLESLDKYLKEINESDKMTLVAVSRGSNVDANKINFVYPKKFNEWTEEELKPFRIPLIKYIDGMSKKVAESLK